MPRFASYASSLFYNSASAGNPYTNATMLFAQPTAPTGWTRIDLAGYTDSTIRITSGTGNVLKGSVAFTTAMSNTYAAMNGTGTTSHVISPTILSSAQICAHQHDSPFPRLSISTNGRNTGTFPSYGLAAPSSSTAVQISPTFGGSGLAHTHPDGSVNVTYTATPRPMAVKYIDSIMAGYTG